MRNNADAAGARHLESVQAAGAVGALLASPGWAVVTAKLAEIEERAVADLLGCQSSSPEIVRGFQLRARIACDFRRALIAELNDMVAPADPAPDANNPYLSGT